LPPTVWSPLPPHGRLHVPTLSSLQSLILVLLPPSLATRARTGGVGSL
jgi:hypothetical protein